MAKGFSDQEQIAIDAAILASESAMEAMAIAHRANSRCDGMEQRIDELERMAKEKPPL